jgi:hypothetical protein
MRKLDFIENSMRGALREWRRNVFLSFAENTNENKTKQERRSKLV